MKTQIEWRSSNGGPGVYAFGPSYSANVKPWAGGRWRWVAATSFPLRRSGSGECDTIEAAREAAEEFINAS